MGALDEKVLVLNNAICAVLEQIRAEQERLVSSPQQELPQCREVTREPSDTGEAAKKFRGLRLVPSAR